MMVTTATVLCAATHLLAASLAPAVPHGAAAALGLLAAAVLGWGALSAPEAPLGWRAPGPRAAVALPAGGAAAALGMLVAGQFGRLPVAAVVLAALALLAGAARLVVTALELRAAGQRGNGNRTDHLTGLPDRAAFEHRLATALAGRQPSCGLAVLLLDADRFKEVNDSLGHGVGDRLLRRQAARLAASLGGGEYLARLGGDEFAVIAESSNDLVAMGLARRLQAVLAAPSEVDGLPLRLEFSVGIASWPTHGQDAASLLARADIAMYRAKARRTGVEVFTADRDGPSRERLETIEGLRRGIVAGEIVCYYQPKFDTASGALVGVEALARWCRPQPGGGAEIVPPVEFIPLAEAAGLLPALTAVVLDQALAQLAAWDRAGVVVPSVAVNVSASSLLELGFVDRVRAALGRAGVGGARLVAEITEDAVITDPQRCAEVLALLRRAGVGISLDDYGTGYSSLALLRDLPLDEIKLDKSFGLQLCADERTAQIVASTVRLAHALGVRMVAEGVETAAAHRRLAAMACDVVQGFLFSRPVPAEEVDRLVTTAAASAAAAATPSCPGDAACAGTTPVVNRR
jgi:diguanylate cyclase (GGDEF)-like protein